MANNYFEALNLSLELEELLVRTTSVKPTVEFFKNNKFRHDIAYDNFHYQFKQKGKQA